MVYFASLNSVQNFQEKNGIGDLLTSRNHLRWSLEWQQRATKLLWKNRWVSTKTETAYQKFQTLLSVSKQNAFTELQLYNENKVTDVTRFYKVLCILIILKHDMTNFFHKTTSSCFRQDTKQGFPNFICTLEHEHSCFQQQLLRNVCSRKSWVFFQLCFL